MSKIYQLVGLMSMPFYMPLKQTEMYSLSRPSQEKFYLHAGDSGSNMHGPEHCAREVDVRKTKGRFSGCFRPAFPLHFT